MSEEQQTDRGVYSKSHSFLINSNEEDVISNLEENLKMMEHKIETLHDNNEALISENMRLKMRNDEANLSMQSLEISQHTSMNYEQELQTENDTLQHIISNDKLEIEKIYAQLFTAKQENATIRQDYRNILNQKQILCDQLKECHDEFNKTKNSLEEAHIGTINNLQKQNESLKYENAMISDKNTKLQHDFDALKHNLMENEECMALLNEEEKQFQIMINEMKNEMETLTEMLNDKNEEIEHLKESIILNSVSHSIQGDVVEAGDDGLHQETHTEIEVETLRKEMNDLKIQIIELTEQKMLHQKEIEMMSMIDNEQSEKDIFSTVDDETEDTRLLKVASDTHQHNTVVTSGHRACGCCRGRVWAFWS